MFKLSFFVEDKHLAKVLRDVSGVALNMDPPQPVINAVAVSKGHKVKAASSAGTMSEKVFGEVQALGKGAQINRATLRGIVTANGGTDQSAYYFAKQMRDRKIIKFTADRGVYTVL